MTTQKVQLKSGMIITVLAICFILATYSLIDTARGATSYPSPSLTPIPIPTEPTQSPTATQTPTITFTPNQTTPTLKPSATPKLTYPLNKTSKFGYSVVGKENSSMPNPKTVTLCNYTTPSNCGTIVQISIYLTGIRGSHVRGVIFANEPEAFLPQGGEPIALSIGYLNLTSVSGAWYNFTMNYKTSPNTVYWLGYYADDYTHYFYNTNNNSISVTSQPKDGNSSWDPVGWHYQGKSVMSLYALYTLADPEPSTTPANLNSASPTSTQSFQDALFVLLVIGAESLLVVAHQTRKKKNATDKYNSSSKAECKTPLRTKHNPYFQFISYLKVLAH